MSTRGDWVRLIWKRKQLSWTKTHKWQHNERSKQHWWINYTGKLDSSEILFKVNSTLRKKRDMNIQLVRGMHICIIRYSYIFKKNLIMPARERNVSRGICNRKTKARTITMDDRPQSTPRRSCPHESTRVFIVVMVSGENIQTLLYPQCCYLRTVIVPTRIRIRLVLSPKTSLTMQKFLHNTLKPSGTKKNP